MKQREKNPGGRGTLRPQSAMERVMTLARPLAVSGLDWALSVDYPFPSRLKKGLTMFSALRKLLGGRSAGNQATRQATARPAARPQLEALEGRLLPSSVPNLIGLTLGFAQGQPNAHYLQILGESDLGNGKGSFNGLFGDPYHGILTGVSGSLWLKGRLGSGYDFGVSYSGQGSWGTTVYQSVSGSGDLITGGISGSPYDYAYGGIPWVYSGQDHEIAITLYGYTPSFYQGSNADVAYPAEAPPGPFTNDYVGVPASM
jgi:hypothetical protein